MNHQELAWERFELACRLGRRIAHDLNNALGVISAHSSLALMSVEEDPDLREDVEAMRDAGRRAAALVRELTVLLPKALGQVVSVEANTVVSGVESLLRRVLGDRVELDVTLAGDDTTVLCDEAELQLLLLSLGMRAAEAMPEEGALDLQVTLVELGEGEATPGANAGPYVRIALSGRGAGADQLSALSGLEMARAIVDRTAGSMKVGHAEGGATIELFYPSAEEDASPGA